MSWRMGREPSLEELLGDEIMEWVTRSAGSSTGNLRREMAELARRLERRRARDGASGCRARF